MKMKAVIGYEETQIDGISGTTARDLKLIWTSSKVEGYYDGNLIATHTDITKIPTNSRKIGIKSASWEIPVISGDTWVDLIFARGYATPEPTVTISEPEPILSISTDKTSYNLGERVMMTLEIDRSEAEPQEMLLELELKESCDEPDLLYQSQPFVMPAVFQKEVTLPIRIDRSIWVSGGEYSFIATLRDPTTDEVIDQDTANFEIVDDMPWTKKLWRNKLRKILR